MLETLVVPACFLVAGLVGLRLGTPPRVAGGLLAVGALHLLALGTGSVALVGSGSGAALLHLLSQWLFLGGFVALVWLAACYPTDRPSPALVAAAGALAAAGPLLAAVTGPTPALADAARELGPVARLLPERLAEVAAAPLVVLPLLAVGVFGLRYRRAEAPDRAAMRWPVAGLALIAVLAVVGTLAPAHQAVVTALFLLGAPVLPLSLAFGPVARRLEGLTRELADVRGRLTPRLRAEPPPGVLARLTPRELTVLEAMAEGMANPVIARTLHLSLSSVEKHATSIFRKLQVPEGADVHRRVAAVVVYRDAVEGAEHRP